MRPALRLLAPLVFVPLLGCGIPGELGNLEFNLSMVDPILEFRSGDAVLVGSRVCTSIAVAVVDGQRDLVLGQQDAAAIRACYSESVAGPAELDAEGCLRFNGVGEVAWSLTPAGECSYLAGVLGDELRFDAVAAGPGLRLGFDDWTARGPTGLSESHTVVGLAPGRSLADLREDPSAPRLVAVAQLDVPTLRLDDGDTRVVWTEPEVSLALLGEGVTAVEPVHTGWDADEPILEYRNPGEQPLLLATGGVARVVATLPDGQVLESPELIAVSPTTAASLDLIVMLEGEEPAFAFAEVRDGQGRVLHGAAVEWSVREGALLVRPGDLSTVVRTADYASLSGYGCEPRSTPPIERHAVLRARLGTLEDTVELTWTPTPLLPPNPNVERLPLPPFEPDPDCMFGDEPPADDPAVDEGCGCTSPTNPSPISLLVPLVGLALVRRRRWARSPSPISPPPTHSERCVA